MRTIDRINTASGEGIPAPVSAEPLCPGTLRWRREQLMAAGMDELTAYRLVRKGDVDVHALAMSAELRSTRAEGERHGR